MKRSDWLQNIGEPVKISEPEPKPVVVEESHTFNYQPLGNPDTTVFRRTGVTASRSNLRWIGANKGRFRPFVARWFSKYKWARKYVRGKWECWQVQQVGLVWFPVIDWYDPNTGWDRPSIGCEHLYSYQDFGRGRLDA